MIFTGASGNDPKNDFEAFLRNYAWIICVAVVVIILLTILIVFVFKNKKSKKPKKIVSTASADEWVEALGGIDNIVEVSSMGSRLSIKIKDRELINRDALTNLGVTSIVLMSDKVTLVTNLDNQKIEDNLKNRLQN